MPTLYSNPADLHRALLLAMSLIKAWRLAHNLALTTAISVVAFMIFHMIDLQLGVRLALLSITVNSLALILAHVRIIQLSK